MTKPGDYAKMSPADPIEPIIEEPVESRTKTTPTRATIVIDLADHDDAAAFLEFVAHAIRERRQLRITVE